MRQGFFLCVSWRTWRFQIPGCMDGKDQPRRVQGCAEGFSFAFHGALSGFKTRDVWTRERLTAESAGERQGDSFPLHFMAALAVTSWTIPVQVCLFQMMKRSLIISHQMMRQEPIRCGLFQDRAKVSQPG